MVWVGHACSHPRRMHLVQLFLPKTDNLGANLPMQSFARVRTTLVERFGGMTAYTRAPARGVWIDEAAEPVDDGLVVYEVVVDRIDRNWRSEYLAGLQAEFRQQRLPVRAVEMELL